MVGIIINVTNRPEITGAVPEFDEMSRNSTRTSFPLFYGLNQTFVRFSVHDFISELFLNFCWCHQKCMKKSEKIVCAVAHILQP